MPNIVSPFRALITIIFVFGFVAVLLSDASSGEELLPHSTGTVDVIAIPAGDFVMGMKEGPIDAPAHTVHIDAFSIEATEVTNAQYFEFCRTTGHRLPEFWGMSVYQSGLDFPDHPVVGVSYFDAKAYAEWAGRRLPTEAEWEYAARGGLSEKLFPNGDELNDTGAVFGGRRLQPVASFEPNDFGLFDMAGNVVEWTADFYDPSTYTYAGRDNPIGPDEGKFRVIRGGGWHSGKYCTRVYHRNALPPGWVDFAVGFRCALRTKAIAEP